jgi:cytochrome c oxidase subunit 2
LQDGSTVDVDENYIRESILEPQAQVVKGYQPVMPSFKGILSDEDITSLIAYIKTLK